MNFRTFLKTAFMVLNVAFSGQAPAKAVDCDDFYFGLGVEKDFKKAFDCAVNAKEHSALLILMYINGEGTPVDLDKAQLVLEEMIGDPKGGGLNASSSEIGRIIATRKQAPGETHKKLDYGDIAMTTYDMNYYSVIRNKLQEQEGQRESALIQKDLDPRTAKALTGVQEGFKPVAELGTKRMYLEYIDGSIRVIAGKAYESYLMDRHQKRVTEWLGKRKIPKTEPGDYLKADKDLNALYKDMQQNGKDRIDAMVARKDRLADSFKGYLPTLKEEQRGWIKYRDTWVALMNLHPPKGFKAGPELEEAVKAILTRERVEELKFDPIVSEGA